jgi:rhodanese-related sulfurtransferase
MIALTTNQLKKMNEEEHEDFILINVLSRETFNKKHIRTSVNVPHEDEDFVDMVEKLAGSKERKIVFYCANFDCDASTEAAGKLEYAGFSNVYDYEDGAKDWFAAEHAQAA